MKRLFKNDRALEFFFDSSATTEQIRVWIVIEIDKLDPNEAHSCTVEIHDENTILLSGDEDSMELEIREVETIKTDWLA